MITETVKNYETMSSVGASIIYDAVMRKLVFRGEDLAAKGFSRPDKVGIVLGVFVGTGRIDQDAAFTQRRPYVGKDTPLAGSAHLYQFRAPVGHSLGIGAVTVPVYPTISEEDYRFILADCDAKMVIIDGLSVMNKVSNILPDAPNVKLVYTMVDRNKYPYFDQLLQLGREHPHAEELAARKAAVDEMSCATTHSG